MRQHGKCLQLGHEPKANLSYFSFMRPKFVKGVCTMFKMLGLLATGDQKTLSAALSNLSFPVSISYDM